MKKIIGVMGPGKKSATELDLDIAYRVGKLIAQKDKVLLCGGMFGTMKESARGAKENDGLTIGIGPMLDKTELNEYIDLPVMTGMHSGRNYSNVLSSDILIFVSVGSPGVLSELAQAIQLKKPSIVIHGSKALRSYVRELSATEVTFVETFEDLEEKLSELL